MESCCVGLKSSAGLVNLAGLAAYPSRMTRFLVLCFLSFVLAVPAVAQESECDAQSALRGEAVHHYVPKVMACVARPDGGFWFDDTVEAEIFDRVNAERLAAGLPALAYRPELLAAARIHSFDMAREGFFAHRGADGRTAYQRIAALDRTLVQSETRENLASVSGELDHMQVSGVLHNLLMDSPSHKDNILAPNITHMAIGLARTGNGAWVTQVFVRQDGTLTAPLKTAHRVGDPLALDANLLGRELAGAVFQGPRGREYTSFIGTDMPNGDLQLLVIGERRIDDLTRQSIKLNGPSISLVR